MSLEVLMVCTGNIHRSPMAERLAIARSAVPSDVVNFSSCGTHAHEGLTMDSASAMALRQLGGDPSGHQSRRLTGPMLETASLVLTATSEQRGHSVRKRPAAMRKTFTLKEFVRLGAGIEPALGPDDVGRLIQQITAQRGLPSAGGPARDEIADPHGAPPSEALRCAVDVALAVDGVLKLLGIYREPQPPTRR
jgi:protein-tyrosine phosphatase